ncbi:acyl carrier protein [Celeribacter ethanolicus]|uniref:acyl carrier protein n=1 Tax=Celeribacter ethanolicus TaxID=1758178 RepID=UPI0008309D9F|nr:acyl carrier protein [Celeribacter ethanolicus]TNE66787.1 MAG: acyl carrier protein [Paracoccaceae bacterium]
MDDTQIRTAILDAVAKAAQVDQATLTDTTPLGAGGLGLDSIAMLDLVLDLEDVTGLQLRSEALGGDDLATLGGLVRYMCSL